MYQNFLLRYVLQMQKLQDAMQFSVHYPKVFLLIAEDPETTLPQ
jgi:hypothetical protein